jgi:hypothetical protein
MVKAVCIYIYIYLIVNRDSAAKAFIVFLSIFVYIRICQSIL